MSQIEVNGPPKIDASLSEMEDAKDAQAIQAEAPVTPELDAFDTDVSLWDIFPASQAKFLESEREEITLPTAAPSQGNSGDHGNENLENKMNTMKTGSLGRLGLEGLGGLEALSSQCSHGQMRMAAVASDSLLPEKLLLFPYDILNRLHKSHLAQLDELWALRTLQQRRQMNVQKSTFLKETSSLSLACFGRLFSAFSTFLSLGEIISEKGGEWCTRAISVELLQLSSKPP